MNEYCVRQIDLDGSRYWEERKDVKLYPKGLNKDIDKVIEKWSNLYQGYYIIGNRFYFKLDGKRYCWSFSSFEEEWWNANEIINDLNCVPGIEHVLYLRGHLD